VGFLALADRLFSSVGTGDRLNLSTLWRIREEGTCTTDC